MRGMREKGAGHRGVRAGVLTPILREAACALGLAASLLLCSCGGAGSQRSRTAAPDPRAAWYQIQGGKFTRIVDPGSAKNVLPQPWTVQSRIADVSFIRNVVMFAVNGSGLAAMDLGGNEPSFAYFYDPLIFAHRTVTSVMGRDSGATVHLYFNEMLNDVSRSALELAGVSLVDFLPDSGEYDFTIPPFQKRNRAWEAVGFVAASANDFFFEWKEAAESETRFGYTRFNSGTGAETTVTREAYIDAFRLAASAASGNGALRSKLFSEIRRRLAPKADDGVHFPVRSRSDAVKRVFRTGGESPSAITTVPVWEEAETLFALLPGGMVLSTSDGASFVSLGLPALPAGCRYTDLVKSGGALLLPWEQTLFTEVRAAGLLIFRP